MTIAVLDTTVIIHLFRKDQAAISWFAAQQDVFSITPITWMEIMVGAPNKRIQVDLLKYLNGFEMIYLTPVDMDWAMKQMLAYRFSHGVAIMDCFNASVCHRLQVPIYTHNQKDYLKTSAIGFGRQALLALCFSRVCEIRKSEIFQLVTAGNVYK